LIWEEGLPAEAIIRTANKIRPDLIISGTHGASGYRESFIGSTAYTVIKYVTCPVLTIPAGTKWLNFKKLLLPVRPIHGAVKKFELIQSIASKNGSLDVLDLSSGNSEDDKHLISLTLDELRSKLHSSQINIQVTRSTGSNVAENVLTMLARSAYDILVLSPSIDMTNKQLFIGPFSQRIINQSPVPVLTIKRSL
jgi:nucleotide-binding universal stress UspA family protein